VACVREVGEIFKIQRHVWSGLGVWICVHTKTNGGGGGDVVNEPVR
jgi:hypothetical protein